MTYGTIKVDTVTFTNDGVDKSVTLSGLVQNPTFSGNVTVTGTLSGVTVTGTTANFTSGNFTNISGGTHTITSGVFAAGSAASPSIAFTGDLNTGIYSPGADQVAISTNGTRRLIILSDGKVGLGAASVLQQGSGVDGGSAAGVLELYNGGTGNTTLENTGAFPILFKTNGTERLRITSAGLVGVGTSSPSDPLHIAVAGANSANIRLQSGDGRTYNIGSTGSGYGSSGKFIVYDITANAERFCINSSGSVGVGTTSPGSIFDVKPSASSSTLRIEAGTINSDSVRLSAGGTVNTYLEYRGYLGHAWFVDATERLRIDSSGRVGIGTSSPSATTKMSIVDSTSAGIYLLRTAQGETVIENTGPLTIRQSSGNGANQNIFFKTGASVGTEVTAMTIDGSQRVGIGTTSPGKPLDVRGTGSTNVGSFSNGTQGIDIATTASGGSIQTYDQNQTLDLKTFGTITNSINFSVGSTERARIDSSGRLLVGTSSTSAAARVLVSGGDGARGVLNIAGTAATPADGDDLGFISFNDSSHIYNNVLIRAQRDGGTWTATTSKPTRLTFSTTADGASSPTERFRINSAGNIGIGNSVATPGTYTNTGPSFGADGYILTSRSENPGLFVNRKTNDGELVQFAQDDVQEGSISVSGTTVSYNGAHLSRWSQLPSGQERTEILRGTVLSNIDDMCEWGEEDNEQLNRMKVSDVEGDKNVSGVFQAWDDDDDTYTNDFYCAMTGDFIIRIAEGITVERGDLLMSAGDGTAKPQGDGFVQDKTVAKVTSTNVSCTYEDGSYCVPCVLMAC